jgi:LDH2 family malate/lactate/ureidoglycolate dehydrogenase|tara:strand:- start:1114 stop:2211 length:1098 start_codon:yes stop_codon:yes gene_type:complete
MSTEYFIVPVQDHNELVAAAYAKRGFTAEESNDAARLSAEAARHGIRTHNAIKALHLDEAFGSGSQGCVPGAEIIEKESRFSAVKIWDAQKKLGQSTAYRALEECIRMADIHGVGIVAVDNAFHYLWGGGYMIEAARRGYIAYTNCTAALAEVVPFKGKFPTLGTNPHSWGFPTTEAIGYPIVVDWATSVIAMGRVEQFKREGMALPADAAVDAEGNVTQDPFKASSLLPFGAHKGYGLSMVNELVAGLIGGSLPTIRSRWNEEDGEKRTPCFFFQVIHPDAISGGAFAKGRDQAANVKAVIGDILGHGNEGCLLPGQMEADTAKLTEEHGGLLFSEAEVAAFGELSAECGLPAWSLAELKSINV